MENKLRSLKINRVAKYGVGKKMGDNIWFHKNYIGCFMEHEEYHKFKIMLPIDFEYHILRWNEKKQEIAFIECNDFDTSNEPIVGRVMRVKKTEDDFKLLKVVTPPSDPLIYHHKWLFVKDCYLGFNIDESKKRSIDWKTKLGIDKTVSNKIGRLSFWDNWLKENKLSARK